MTQLENKVAVVTGGSRGIGAAIAGALVAAGARVVISGRTERTVKETAERLGALGVVADASDPESAREPARQAIEQLGGVSAALFVTAANPAAGARRPTLLTRFTQSLGIFSKGLSSAPAGYSRGTPSV